MADNGKVFGMRFGKVWPLLVRKAERKGRTARHWRRSCARSGGRPMGAVACRTVRLRRGGAAAMLQVISHLYGRNMYLQADAYNGRASAFATVWRVS